MRGETMASKLIKQPAGNKNASRLIKAINMTLAETSEMPEKGQFGFKATLQTPTVILHNTDFDMEFNIPFDDDMEANEAEFIVYNLSDSTANKFKLGNSICMTAGYGEDTGIIFQGFISKVKTERLGTDKVTTIYALDDVQYTPQMMKEFTYAAWTPASEVLRNLLEKTKLPVEVFEPQRDHVYEDELKIDGSIVENIKTYSDVCGVSTYIHKQKIYCRPIMDGDNLYFRVNSDTGMIESPEPFEEENENEEYTDIVTGYNVKMILQHRISTAGIVQVDSVNYSGLYRIVSGTHSYDGLSATTDFKCIENITTKVDETKVSSQEQQKSQTHPTQDLIVYHANYIAKGRFIQEVDRDSYVLGYIYLALEGACVAPKNLQNSFVSEGYDKVYETLIYSNFLNVSNKVNISDGAYLEPGDVLLATGENPNIAIYMGNNQIFDVCYVEEEPDYQDVLRSGYMMRVTTYYDHPWQYVFRYNTFVPELAKDPAGNNTQNLIVYHANYIVQHRYINPNIEMHNYAMSYVRLVLGNAGVTFYGIGVLESYENVYEKLIESKFLDVTEQVNTANGEGMELGDILLTTGDNPNIALYMGNNKVFAVYYVENGENYDGNFVSGWSMRITDYFDHPWQYVHRYKFLKIK